MSQKDNSREQFRMMNKVSGRKALILAATLVATVSLAAVAYGINSNSGRGGLGRVTAKSNTTASATTVNSTQQGQPDEVRVQLTTSGFNPSAVTHAAGPFSIAVQNMNVTGEYVLQLKAADGTVLNEIRVQKGSPVWGVNLQAGSYTLTEANHPGWVCQFTIQ